MDAFQLTQSPFEHDPTAPKVYVASGLGAYDNTREVLSKIDLGPATGKRVLIKPNAGRMAGPGSGINTHPMAIAAAVDAFRDEGAVVAIGESPITGVKTMEAFEISGIADIARERDCPLIDMDERKYVDVELPEGVVMKMHMHTGVTLGVKNMKGCLWRRSKVVLHMLPPVDGRSEKPLDIAIADMSYALRPHLTIIDGWVGMEGIGPSAGKPKQLDAAVLGVDAFAADAVACALMGTNAYKIPHLKIGADRGYGCIDLERINVSPSDWRNRAAPFATPPTDISIGFPEFDILDLNSCSACQSSLLLFLKGYGTRILEYFPGDHKVSVAIGKGHETVPRGCLCIGNCTARVKEQGIYVKGCPPVGSEILRAITGHPTVDDKDANPEENH